MSPDFRLSKRPPEVLRNPLHHLSLAARVCPGFVREPWRTPCIQFAVLNEKNLKHCSVSPRYSLSLQAQASTINAANQNSKWLNQGRFDVGIQATRECPVAELPPAAKMAAIAAGRTGADRGKDRTRPTRNSVRTAATISGPAIDVQNHNDCVSLKE